MGTTDTTPANRALPLTVEHVTNSLQQIELWVGAVRAALAGLEPGMPLPGSERPPLFVSPNRVKKDCPPAAFTPKKKRPTTTTTKKKKK